MKEKLRVLHLASFLGNIGDNANHIGFRQAIANNLDFEMEYTDLEIRQFYRKERAYDADFVEYVNEFDLFIIGGGNYFELWPTNSPTGTSVGFSVEQMGQIKCPILFNALGVDIGQGIGEGSKEKFKRFLDYCLAHPKIFVSVRNDGAIRNLKEVLGEHYASSVFHTPDGGFFLPVSGMCKTRVAKYVGINVVSDMASVRFSENGIDSFIRDLRSFVFWLSELGYKCIFFPHIPLDLTFIAEIIAGIKNDRILREDVVVAPSEQGIDGLKSILSYYAQCDLIVATRFHANVLGMILKIPTIGLNNYPQIGHLYRELGLLEQTVKTNENDFLDKLKGKFEENQSTVGRAILIEKYEILQKKHLKIARSYQNELSSWLTRCRA